MTCTRCGCTEDRPCPGGCAWSMPEVCNRCLTPDESRLEQQYATLLVNLREALESNRFERYLLAAAQGMAANSALGVETCEAGFFADRAVELALGLIEAAEANADEGAAADDDDDDRASRLVLP